MKNKNTDSVLKKGFSLLEVLLVVAALGILASIVILAINPAKQMADTRNAQRRAEINAIIDAVYQYDIDRGKIPQTITEDPTEICKTDVENCEGMIDLSVLTDKGEYVVAMPTDPSTESEIGTGYGIYKTEFGRIVVTAPGAERAAIIEIQR